MREFKEREAIAMRVVPRENGREREEKGEHNGAARESSRGRESESMGDRGRCTSVYVI